MTRRALLIANGRFDDERIGRLKSPATDIDRLATLLATPDVGGYAVTTCHDADAAAMRLAIQAFLKTASADDLNLVLISGHGLKDRSGKLHFAARDTCLDSLQATSVEARFLMERMEESPAAQQLVFLDTCYSGAFQRGMVAKAVVEVSRDDFGESDSVGTAVVTATTAVQLAGENEAGGLVQSVFTRHLIEGIATGQADVQCTGRITLEDLIRHIRKGVRRDAPGQTPQPYYFGLDGSVVVAFSPQRQTLPEKLRIRLSDRDRTVRAAAAEDLIEHVRANPSARQTALAALNLLRADDSTLVRSIADEALIKLGAGAPLAAEVITSEREARERVATAVGSDAIEATDDPSIVPIQGGAGRSDDGRLHRVVAISGVAFVILALLALTFEGFMRGVFERKPEVQDAVVRPPVLAPVETAAASPPSTSAAHSASKPKVSSSALDDDFAARYWTMWSSNNAIVEERLGDFYADRVTYYGQTIPFAEVRRQKLEFIRRFPNRQYNPRAVQQTCAAELCRVSGLVDWRAGNDDGVKAGRATFEFRVRIATGKIVSETTAAQ